MRKVFTVFVLFIIISFVADRLLGSILHTAFTHSNCIESYVYQKCDADIVVLGSSRAHHHYVPSIITDSIGLSCYNLGADGKNIYYQYASMNLLLTHHIPKIVIYDCFSVDVSVSDFKYDLGSLSDYYPIYGENKAVDSLIDMQGAQYISRIICSHSYRYNSRFLDHLKGNNDAILCGYEPSFGIYDKGLTVQRESITIDNSKIGIMQKLIDLCKEHNIRIIFAVSPRYALNETDGPMTRKYEVVNELCQKNNVPFLYYELDSLYLKDNTLFRDIGHLNETGAVLFSEHFSKDLKEILYRNN